jgi:virginiamycin B lyase
MKRAVVAGLALALAACTSEPPPGARSSPSPPASPSPSPSPDSSSTVEVSVMSADEFGVPAGARPHDVAPAADGTVWYTGQGNGTLGRLDPKTRKVEEFPLGSGSAPHGVIVGPDGAAWITDGGRNEIIRFDPATKQTRRFKVPSANANLNTAAFGGDGTVWFTGQAGIYGRVTKDGRVQTWNAPKGRGPYGICATPSGDVWFSSLAGSYIARIDPSDPDRPRVVDTPAKGGGARRVWSDSKGMLWVTEWFAGKLARYDPAANAWREWKLPGDDPQPYAVYVDERDDVWISDFGGKNPIVRFWPFDESFEAPTKGQLQQGINVRQLLGRTGEVWGAESAKDKLVVVRRTVL